MQLQICTRKFNILIIDKLKDMDIVTENFVCNLLKPPFSFKII